MSGLGCNKCDKTGHFDRDFTATTTTTLASGLIYFYCNQKGDKKVNSPCLTAGEVAAPAATTLRITNDREGKAVTLVVKSRDFQLMAENARVTSDVVTRMDFLF